MYDRHVTEWNDFTVNEISELDKTYFILYLKFLLFSC